jgi:hypothetical protein
LDNGAQPTNKVVEEEKQPVIVNGDGGQIVKIWHWNVNGIRAVIKSNKFEEFMR